MRQLGPDSGFSFPGKILKTLLSCSISIIRNRLRKTFRLRRAGESAERYPLRHADLHTVFELNENGQANGFPALCRFSWGLINLHPITMRDPKSLSEYICRFRCAGGSADGYPLRLVHLHTGTQIRQSRPEFCLDLSRFTGKACKTFQVVPISVPARW